MYERDSIAFSCFIKNVFLYSDLVIIFRGKVRDSVNSFSSSTYLDRFLHYISLQYSLSRWFVWTVIRVFQILSRGVLWQETLWWLLFVLHRGGSCDAFAFMENRGETSVVPRQRSPEHQQEFGDLWLDVRRRRIANAGKAPFVSVCKRKVNSWWSQDAVGCQEVNTGKKTQRVRRRHLVPSWTFSNKVVTWYVQDVKEL